MKITLIFIGDDFYLKSKTRMGSLYTLDGIRFDWGKVNAALKNGAQVDIRPAAPVELDYFNKMLADLVG
jgi:hypothetical protein